ncbi:MAG: class I tRNA ligase family protein, partial [bacterium]|nr:class I tRNA ligase family protein [bacterium]
ATSRATKRITESIEHFRFNTAISTLMETLNGFQSLADEAGGMPAAARSYFERYLVLLTPFAPHIAEELWQELGHEDSIFEQDWPAIDQDALKQDTATIVVQVNGKVRATVTLPAEGLTEEAADAAARSNEIVQKYLGNAEPKQVIYVPGKLLNFVI